MYAGTDIQQSMTQIRMILNLLHLRHSRHAVSLAFSSNWSKLQLRASPLDMIARLGERSHAQQVQKVRVLQL